MRFFYKLTLSLFTLLLAASQQGQSQALIGDIAFTGYNSSPAAGGDDFSFMILKPGGLPASTVINFTNCAWIGGLATACNLGNPNLVAGNGSTESDIAWTSPASVLPYGTQVRISMLTASVGTVTGIGIDLSGIGDQILAFTGARATPSFIAGIQMNMDPGASSNTWDNIAASSTTASNRPACLTDGTYSVWLGPTETDNAALRCSALIPNTQAAALAFINNAANWDKQDATAFSLPRSCPIPVQLISFQAQNNVDNITAKWQVTNEVNFSHYDVERSFDNKTFDKIASLFAKGGSGIQNYSYSDMESVKNNAAVIYYRLKMVDIDGRFNYSEIVRVRNKKDATFVIDNLTNPVKDRVSFTLITKTAGIASIQLSDVNGKIISTRSLQVNIGSNTINLSETAGMAQGMYLLKVMTAGGNTVTRIIK
jgi:Secretion system C-terminal sorting domain